jgi:hypothetical protein
MSSTTIPRQIKIWQDPRAIALLMAASLTTMANATISPALPGLERLFGDDPNSGMLVRLLVPAPSISVAIFAPFAGLIADRYGRRRMLLAGVILFVTAGCAGLFLPDLPTIFASRLVLGLAVALIMTAQTALIGDYFTSDDRRALSGLQISAWNFGGARVHLARRMVRGDLAAFALRHLWSCCAPPAVDVEGYCRSAAEPAHRPCQPRRRLLRSFVMGRPLRVARASPGHDEHDLFRYADAVVVLL